jgi:hypothetical protein
MDHRTFDNLINLYPNLRCSTPHQPVSIYIDTCRLCVSFGLRTLIWRAADSYFFLIFKDHNSKQKYFYCHRHRHRLGLAWLGLVSYTQSTFKVLLFAATQDTATPLPPPLHHPHTPAHAWWVWMDSNHRPPPYQDGALTN